MTTACIILLVLAALATVVVIALSQDMWTSDGFGRSIARSLTSLAVIVAWSLLAAAWILIAIRGDISAGRVAGVGAAFAAACAAAWGTITVAGRAATPRWLVVALDVPPLFVIALTALAGQPHWRAAVPDLLVRGVWVAVFILAALPWRWVIRKWQLDTQARAKVLRS